MPKRAQLNVARILTHIEEEQADMIATTEADLWVTFTPEMRARLIDFYFYFQTTEASLELRGRVDISLN